jgi:nicotinamide mononucleotide (NMN) deamidase PncC
MSHSDHGGGRAAKEPALACTGVTRSGGTGGLLPGTAWVAVCFNRDLNEIELSRLFDVVCEATAEGRLRL